jgi:enoyl-CoA hydratase/3-hydroxyacyl-CoA dehydrogenase
MRGTAGGAAQTARDCSRLVVHMDSMRKPVVAALNGMALGGGLELAMRCHGSVAQRDAWLQFPEITLGIAPGMGAMVVPYRRWPQAAALFHAMLRQAERIDAVRAQELGIISALADDYGGLVRGAAGLVHALAGKPRAALDRPVPIAPFTATAPGTQVLSHEVIGIVEEAVRTAAAAPTLAAALEIGYRAFGRSACTAAAREGITAFGERRKPDFARTG